MLSIDRTWHVCSHTCLWSELFPGSSTYSAGTGVCVCVWCQYTTYETTGMESVHIKYPVTWQCPRSNSGSVLGHIYHHDPRTPTPLVGAASQEEAVCSLQWSPGEEWLASGSTGGLLHIWDSDITEVRRSCQPVITMKQPSAVKVSWLAYLKQSICDQNSLVLKILPSMLLVFGVNVSV